jgi:hypothetical protein
MLSKPKNEGVRLLICWMNNAGDVAPNAPNSFGQRPRAMREQRRVTDPAGEQEKREGAGESVTRGATHK